MNVTYRREVGHCEPSPYIKMVTIKSVQPANNSDMLEKIEFNEIGWNCISRKGLHFVGEKVLFIPPESVLPFELETLLDIVQYTSNGRIKVTNLRGNRSEGIIVDPDMVTPYIPYIMKWEDLPTLGFAGSPMGRSDTPIDFMKFYKMPNILNEPETFSVGEPIWYSEKIHGTNMRFGRFPHPHTQEYQDYVGSHEVVLKETEGNLYWKVFNSTFKDKIPTDKVFFCEAYGVGVQHLTYGATKGPEARVFAIMERGEYLPPHIVAMICRRYEIPCVEFHHIIFNDIEEIRTLADSPSEVTSVHYREGIVMVSEEHPEKMAKCIGFTYFTNNQGKNKKKRTERH
jgi:RNA ligase (TIGR02306 family)